MSHHQLKLWCSSVVQRFLQYIKTTLLFFVSSLLSICGILTLSFYTLFSGRTRNKFLSCMPINSFCIFINVVLADCNFKNYCLAHLIDLSNVSVRFFACLRSVIIVFMFLVLFFNKRRNIVICFFAVESSLFCN